MHFLVKSNMCCIIITVKAQHYFVCSSYMFLLKKTVLKITVLKIWLNPGLNLTIFRGTGQSLATNQVKVYFDGDEK